MFFDVKPEDRVQGNDGRTGVCVRTLGMLVFVLWDGEQKESTVNAFYLHPVPSPKGGSQ